MTDEEIKRRWIHIQKGYHSRSSLARRLAMLEVEELEKAGVIEADIDRLFPLTPTQIWLRDDFIDPSIA